MRIEEYILRKLLDRFESTNYLNDWDANQIAYFSGAKDAISVVKEAIMEHYNDKLVGEDEVTRFCVENNCQICDTCERSYYSYGCELNCPREYATGCSISNDYIVGY
jgi:tRNA uridine 5-carbamoylmethylation protein Kti12